MDRTASCVSSLAILSTSSPPTSGDYKIARSTFFGLKYLACVLEYSIELALPHPGIDLGHLLPRDARLLLETGMRISPEEHTASIGIRSPPYSEAVSTGLSCPDQTTWVRKFYIPSLERQSHRAGLYATLERLKDGVLEVRGTSAPPTMLISEDVGPMYATRSP